MSGRVWVMVDELIDVDAFVRDGFVKVEQATPREIADRAGDLLWSYSASTSSPGETMSNASPIASVNDTDSSASQCS